MTFTKHKTETLIKLCKENNQMAQMEIYNRYYKAMYNTAYRIVKDKFEAEDVMQHAFLQAFTKINTLKDIKTFTAWLKKIVVNKSIQHYKKNTTHNEVPLNDILYKVEDNTQTNISNEFNSIKAQQVLDTMSQLKDNYRVALTLNLIEGYDYEEISNIMNITNANCRTIISRAKDSLRQKMLALVS